MRFLRLEVTTLVSAVRRSMSGHGAMRLARGRQSSFENPGSPAASFLHKEDGRTGGLILEKRINCSVQTRRPEPIGHRPADSRAGAAIVSQRRRGIFPRRPRAPGARLVRAGVEIEAPCADMLRRSRAPLTQRRSEKVKDDRRAGRLESVRPPSWFGHASDVVSMLASGVRRSMSGARRDAPSARTSGQKMPRRRADPRRRCSPQEARKQAKEILPSSRPPCENPGSAAVSFLHRRMPCADMLRRSGAPLTRRPPEKLQFQNLARVSGR